MDSMNIFPFLLTIFGLALFETVSSIDNAIINADVLSTMGARSRRWFLLWGMFFAVFVVRGLLPFAIVWAVNPTLGFWGAVTLIFSGDSSVADATAESAPILLMGGGVFLVFLFFHWLFIETKNIGLSPEAFFMRQGVWFYAVASILLTALVWHTIWKDPLIAFAAVVGSTTFFITHGFKQNAAEAEKHLGDSSRSDFAKILFLEIIDTTFSIDGVLGAFAFTLSVPLIILGNGLGAIIVRQVTVGNIDRIKRYAFLKNGAMYSIMILGVVMILDSLGAHIPSWISPISTFLVVGYFFSKSIR